MIKINLLPEDLRKEEFSLKRIGIGMPGGGKLVRNAAIGIVAVLIIMHSALFLVSSTSSSAVKKLSKKFNRLLPQRKEYTALKDEVGLSNRKAKTIDDLMANRFSWAKKLNELSDSIIPGIWLTGLTYDETQGEVAVAAEVQQGPSMGMPPMSGPGGAPHLRTREAAAPQTKKIVLRYLVMSGYASSMGEQGTSLVGKFIKSMKDNSEFSSDFSDIKLESIKSDKIQEQEVMSFKITCSFKTGG